MNSLLQRLSSLHIGDETRCVNCKTSTSEHRSQCDICSAISFSGSLCEWCSQVVIEFEAKICYYHLREMANMNAIAYCSECDELLIHECEHNIVYLDCERAKRILCIKYPHALQTNNTTT